ncbi:hypothetical protein AGDE_14699 [Angomonas deanei]|uniref:Secreted protein n=1 Tax=Angomonas deanei TaxID=59799 RepID=A0A7G2C6D7_9TRYP|nr:hypothetical protein AGDE_14699 [Angomonas deanei]CAD2215388.1 hypothetical protein, conserved [Angomonas deanei]|eukprot:EPY20400.1 hypothetical protein AGDE_14699 [Angomonas deanei]
MTRRSIHACFKFLAASLPPVVTGAAPVLPVAWVDSSPTNSFLLWFNSLSRLAFSRLLLRSSTTCLSPLKPPKTFRPWNTQNRLWATAARTTVAPPSTSSSLNSHDDGLATGLRNSRLIISEACSPSTRWRKRGAGRREDDMLAFASAVRVSFPQRTPLKAGRGITVTYTPELTLSLRPSLAASSASRSNVSSSQLHVRRKSSTLKNNPGPLDKTDSLCSRTNLLHSAFRCSGVESPGGGTRWPNTPKSTFVGSFILRMSETSSSRLLVCSSNAES